MKYKKDRTCPKCGEKYIKTQYNGGYIDWIIRQCINCGYKWDEEPLDKYTDENRIIRQCIKGGKICG